MLCLSEQNPQYLIHTKAIKSTLKTNQYKWQTL